jgi:hypothetical protein
MDDCHGLYPGVSAETITEMSRHYARWLSRQPFGIERSEEYFAYRLGRERFIARRSKLGWPELIITMAYGSANDCGYALTECSGMTMRILEVIGSPDARQELWRELYRKALRLGLRRMRGWESVVADFAPSFSYQWIGADLSTLPNGDRKILYFERDWGKPMMLTFNHTLESWFRVFPCPLLELDL